MNLEKQMTTNSRWLMRPGATVPKGAEPIRPPVSIAKLLDLDLSGAEQRAGQYPKRRPYEDLSRMKGNFHVRFLGECGRGNPPALTRPRDE